MNRLGRYDILSMNRKPLTREQLKESEKFFENLEK